MAKSNSTTAFLAEVHAVTEAKAASETHLFAAASMIPAILPETLVWEHGPQKTKHTMTAKAAMEAIATDPVARGGIVAFLRGMLGTKPDASKAANADASAKYKAALASIYRITFVYAASVAFGVEWHGNTFAVPVSKLSVRVGKETKRLGTMFDNGDATLIAPKLGKDKPGNVIFGQSKPDRIIYINDDGANIRVAATYSLLANSVSLVTNGTGRKASKGTTAPKFEDIAKAFRSWIEVAKNNKAIDDKVREEMMVTRNVIDAALGIEEVKAPPQKRQPKAKVA